MKFAALLAPLAPPLGELPSASEAEGVVFVGWYQAPNTTPPTPYSGVAKTGEQYHGNGDTPSAPGCALGQLPPAGEPRALHTTICLCTDSVDMHIFKKTQRFRLRLFQMIIPYIAC